MKKYVLDYMSKFGVDKDAVDSVICNLERAGESAFDKLKELYVREYPIKLQEMEEVLLDICKKSGLEKRQVNLLGVLALFPQLEKRLKERGVDGSIIDKTLVDAVYKMRECKRVFGVYGLMQFSWFKAILEERCYGIGRLQFEIDGYRLDEYSKGAYTVKKGQPSLSVHIPGSGEEFSEKACKEAYRGAVEFFKTFFPNVFPGAIAFTSWTWLLWPGNTAIMRENSNILRFQKDFDIIEVDLYKTNDSIAWRIFDVDKIEDAFSLPENTYLQKKAKEYILSGKLLGWGFGVFFME